MRILVTGGAGYIGSTVCHYLKAAGHEVIVVDEYGGWEPECDEFHLIDLANESLEEYDLYADAVIHLAALIEVGESVEHPIRYLHNNLVSLLNVLSWMDACNVMDIVFASSAAVYGNEREGRLFELAGPMPNNPYGHTKALGEQLIHELTKLRAVSLRLFNVSGWDPDVGRGESHEPETHLIPRAIQAAMGHGSFAIYGADYKTHDGTCIRDYVHVSDVARAFLTAVENTFELDGDIFNIGTGIGKSVREILNIVECVVGQRIEWPIRERRLGDPSKLTAWPARAEKLLGWKPTKSIEDIVKSAYEWEKKRWKAK